MNSDKNHQMHGADTRLKRGKPGPRNHFISPGLEGAQRQRPTRLGTIFHGERSFNNLKKGDTREEDYSYKEKGNVMGGSKEAAANPGPASLF